MGALDPDIRDLARGRNFGTITALLPSGRILSQVMWVDADDDHILINTELGRAKADALAADPRTTVTVWDSENPYHYAEVRGRVVEVVRGPEARAHIDKLSEKYNGQPYNGDWIRTERIILKVAPEVQRKQ